MICIQSAAAAAAAAAVAAAAAAALCVAILLLLLQPLLLLLAAAVHHRVPMLDGKSCCWSLESDSSVLFLFIQDAISFNAPLGSTVAFRLILMRIRFRASICGQIDFFKQKQTSVVQIETGFMCKIGSGDGAQGNSFVSRWTQKNEANVDCCCVWRREETRCVHLGRPRTQVPEPALTDSSLAAERRAEALHVLFCSTQHPSPVRTMTADCCLLRIFV